MIKRKSTALQLGQFLALLASLLIATQIGIILFQGTPLCLNGGCTVVDQLIKVSPLVVNLFGLCFFQIVFWGLHASRNEPRRLPQWVTALLLAGLAVEGVLVPFQYLVAHTFCTYCLGVFGFIVVLNLLVGLKQIMPGLLLFSAVSLAFAGLDINQPQSDQQAFTSGTFASRTGTITDMENFLFYSSTCAHCEKVIASLRNNDRPTVHFNPIDQVKNLDLPGISYTKAYSPAANRALLKVLAIDEIPVLLTKTPEGLVILRGETAILASLVKTTPETTNLSGSSAVPASQAVIPGLEPKDGCSTATDCTDLPGTLSPGQSGP